MSGVRAELAVKHPTNCCLSGLAETDERRELLAQTHHDGVNYEEFIVSGDTIAVDANNVTEVYCTSNDHVYRIEHEGDRGCPCESVEQQGCPVVNAYVEKETVHITFHSSDTETLNAVIDGVKARHNGVSVERLIRVSDGVELVIKDTLTDRQRDLVTLAVECGYYDTPRTCSLSELAEEAGISKSTASGVLHRAEERMVKQYLNTDT